MNDWRYKRATAELRCAFEIGFPYSSTFHMLLKCYSGNYKYAKFYMCAWHTIVFFYFFTLGRLYSLLETSDFNLLTVQHSLTNVELKF